MRNKSITIILISLSVLFIAGFASADEANDEIGTATTTFSGSETEITEGEGPFSLTPSEITGTVIASGEVGYGPARGLARSSNGNLHSVYIRSDGSYNQVYYSQSTDGGQTWQEEQITFASQNHYYPSIAIDSQNYIHLVWGYYRGTPSGPDETSAIQYRLKTTTWQSIEDVINLQSHPSIAIDKEDNVHLAVGGIWGGGYSCHYLKYLKRTSSGWSPPETVSSACWANNPAITIDENNNVQVAYRHSPGRYCGLRYRQKTVSGWQSEEIIQTDDQFWLPGSAALDSNGNLYAVWYNLYTGSIKLRKRTSAGWQLTEEIYPESQYLQSNPRIAIDSNDYLHLIWQGKHSDSPDYFQIRYRKYTDSWSQVQNLTSASQDQRNANPIWAWWPQVDDIRPNLPQTGYAFIWNDGSTIKFYPSPDLRWEVPVPTYNIAVILAEPADVSHESDSITVQPCKLIPEKTYPNGHSKEYYQDLAYCVADYHKENSFETLNLDFEIFDDDGNWFKTTKNEEAYLDKEHEFVIDTVNLATSTGVDLSDKDVVIVLHSGTSYQKVYHWLLNPNPQKLFTQTWSPDSQPLGPFPYKIIVAEDDMIGAWAHEIGHIIGALITPENTVIPDLSHYDIPMGDVEKWDLMARGSLNDDRNNPPHMSSYTKEFLQWLDYDIHPKSAYGEYWINSLETSELGDSVFRYNLSEDVNDESPEYYILEARNRNLKIWDSSLPGLPIIEDKNLILYQVETKGLPEYGYVPTSTADYQTGMMWNQYRKVTIPGKGSINDGILNPLFNETYRDLDKLVKFTALTDRTIDNRYEIKARVGEITNDSFTDKFWGVILRPSAIFEQKIKTIPAIFASLDLQLGVPLKRPVTASEAVAGIGRFILWSLLIPLILLGLLLLFLNKIIISRLKPGRVKKTTKIIFKIVWISALISFIVFIICLVLVPILEKVEPLPPSPKPGELWTPLSYAISSDLDLHLYCKDGKHIGMNYETGEYEIQIAEAMVSGDNQNTPEWIFIPPDITGCHFVISSYDNQKFLEENPEIAQEMEDTTDSYEVYARYIDPETAIYTSAVISEDVEPGAELEHPVSGTHDITIKPGILMGWADFDPDTLNLKSNGKWVTIFLGLPIGYNVNEINLESIRLNDQIPMEPKPTEIGDYDGNGILDLMVKFNRLAIQGILEVGEEVRVIISGKLIDESPFEGSDVIRVISQGK